MDPHELLSAEHQDIRQQAAVFKTLVAKNATTLPEALTSFQRTVQKHFKREDAYYRVLDDGKRMPDRGLIHQLRNDHAAVVFTLESLAIRLRKNGPNADWKTRFENMMNVLLPHLDQEDQELFMDGRKILTPAELEQISQLMQACE